MNPYELFGMDKNLEIDGIDIDYGEFAIRIARAGGANKKFGRLLMERTKPYRRRIDNGTMDESLAEKILRETYTDAIIIGWHSKKFGENRIPGKTGEPMEFSRENCIKLLVDLPEIFTDLQQQAGSAANFRLAEIKADERD